MNYTILLLATPLASLGVLFSALGWLVFGPVDHEVVVHEQAQPVVMDDARQCVNNIPEEVGETNQVGFTPLGTVLSFTYDGSDVALSHERVHMFQLCTKQVTVLDDEYYSTLAAFHPAVSEYALLGRGLTELRMEHEAWTVQDRCHAEWNILYSKWVASDVTTEEAAAFLRGCIK